MAASLLRIFMASGIDQSAAAGMGFEQADQG